MVYRGICCVKIAVTEGFLRSYGLAYKAASFVHSCSYIVDCCCYNLHILLDSLLISNVNTEKGLVLSCE